MSACNLLFGCVQVLRQRLTLGGRLAQQVWLQGQVPNDLLNLKSHRRIMRFMLKQEDGFLVCVARILLQGICGHNGHLAQSGLYAGPRGKAIKVASVQQAGPVGRHNDVHLSKEFSEPGT